MFNVIAGVFVLCVGLLILAGLAGLVYYLVYTRRVNQRIQSGEITGRKMTDIPKVLMGIALAVLIVICVLLGNALRTEVSRAENKVPSRYASAAIDISDPEHPKYDQFFGTTETEDAPFAAVYSEESNEGYDKEVVQQGDFKATVFRRTGPYNPFTPDYLCFVEYTGSEKDVSLYCSQTVKETGPDGHMSSHGGAGGAPVHKLLMIGNLDEGTEYVLDIGVMTIQQEADFTDLVINNTEVEFQDWVDYTDNRVSVSIRFDPE